VYRKTNFLKSHQIEPNFEEYKFKPQYLLCFFILNCVSPSKIQTSEGKKMKIRVVSSREEIFTLNPNERLVHLAFRPSNKDIFSLVENCPKTEVVQLPKSYMVTVSKSIKMFLNMQRIQLIEGDVWGHRKDINEYYSIPSSIIEEIKELKTEGKSNEAIEAKISRESKLNPEMVAYIMTKDNPA
jgi:hypothetical protein